MTNSLWTQMKGQLGCSLTRTTIDIRFVYQICNLKRVKWFLGRPRVWYTQSTLATRKTWERKINTRKANIAYKTLFLATFLTSAFFSTKHKKTCFSPWISFHPVFTTDWYLLPVYAGAKKKSRRQNVNVGREQVVIQFIKEFHFGNTLYIYFRVNVSTCLPLTATCLLPSARTALVGTNIRHFLRMSPAPACRQYIIYF